MISGIYQNYSARDCTGVNYEYFRRGLSAFHEGLAHRVRLSAAHWMYIARIHGHMSGVDAQCQWSIPAVKIVKISLNPR